MTRSNASTRNLAELVRLATDREPTPALIHLAAQIATFTTEAIAGITPPRSTVERAAIGWRLTSQCPELWRVAPPEGMSMALGVVSNLRALVVSTVIAERFPIDRTPGFAIGRVVGSAPHLIPSEYADQ